VRGYAIKLVIGIAGLIVLERIGFIDLNTLIGAAQRPLLLAVAFLCLLATVPLAAWRWSILLNGLNFKLKTTFISMFAHTFLPGAYGGDFVRLAVAYRATGSGLNRLAFSIFLDRLTGLAALLVLGLAVLPVLPVDYADRFTWVLGVALAVGFSAVSIALLAGDRLERLLRRLPKPVGPMAAHVVSELVGALRAYASRPAVVGRALILSLVQYVFVLGSLVVLGDAMRLEGLSLAGYVVAGVWSLVANALPITPGGLGVGEAVFAKIATELATSSLSQSFGSVFLAMRVLSIVISVIGILPFSLNRGVILEDIGSLRAATHPGQGTKSAK
jgi:glycosyltransferase 2 family protein